MKSHKQRDKARTRQRRQRLSVPITPERIAVFVKHLVAISFGAESECWFYVGCAKGTTLSDDLTIKMNRYANVKFNGETVGPHQFAWCAANGVTLSKLPGSDIHHAAEFGRCIGYRCCNPDHLDRVPTRDHSGKHDNASLVRFHSKTVREILEVPQSSRRPAEHLTLTGSGSRRRFLGGQAFLIRGGVIEGIHEDVTSVPKLS